MFPAADVPVFQLSLDRGLPPKRHYEIGRELAPLRERGLLIVGSGNMVHNLGMMEWYLPMLYSLSLQGKNEPLSFFTEKVALGCVSMRGFRIG